MYEPIETYRGVVYPWVIDHVGHMNVQFYTARFDEASWQFLAQLGLTPAFMKRNARAAVAVEQRTQYKREVIAGTLLHITSELAGLGRTSIRFVHRMFDSETREEVAVSELVGVYFDTDCRAATPLPASVHRRANEMRTPRAEESSEVGDDTAEMVIVT
jgi:acyl-CoA thioester hydrolase